MPAEASGCRNYQGIAWYRKTFILPKSTRGKNVELHFEAIMGKQRIYIDGRLVKEHEGGYLPITVNLTQLGIRPGEKHIIAVMTDNSNDKTFPPGKPQYTLDFAYHGGIYRDVWLIAKNKVAITDAIEENKVAGGGIFVHYGTISQQLAEVFVNTEVRNTDQKTRTITVENSIGAVRKTSKVTLAAGACKTVVQKLIIKHPSLRSPETPYLYRLATRILEGKTAHPFPVPLQTRNIRGDDADHCQPDSASLQDRPSFSRQKFSVFTGHILAQHRKPCRFKHLKQIVNAPVKLMISNRHGIIAHVIHGRDDRMRLFRMPAGNLIRQDISLDLVASINQKCNRIPVPHLLNTGVQAGHAIIGFPVLFI
jgi:hypothetical protein